MLKSPSHVVVGSSDLAASIEFLRLFDCEQVLRSTLPAAAASVLYGLDGPAEEVVMATPGAALGRTRLVSTPLPARSFAPLDSRAFAIDYFTTDLNRSLAIAGEAGHHTSPIATHQFGPMTLREVEVRGPDDLIVTLLESPLRRPSVLDTEPERLHSEVHAFVWSVKGIDDLLPFWVECAGMETITDAVFKSPDMGTVLGVPDRDIEARLAVFCDTEQNPVRLELIEFVGEPAETHGHFPLHAGLHAPAFLVESLDEQAELLKGLEATEPVEIDTPVHPQAEAVSALAPGGLRFEIWQQGCVSATRGSGGSSTTAG